MLLLNKKKKLDVGRLQTWRLLWFTVTDTPVRNELNRLQEMKKKSQSKKKKYETQNKIFMTRKRKLDLESNEKKNVESH